MKKSRYTEEQIALALKQAETGTPVAEVKLLRSQINGCRLSLDQPREIASSFGEVINLLLLQTARTSISGRSESI